VRGAITLASNPTGVSGRLVFVEWRLPDWAMRGALSRILGPRREGHNEKMKPRQWDPASIGRRTESERGSKPLPKRAKSMCITAGATGAARRQTPASEVTKNQANVILSLQRSAGNTAVAGLLASVQRKATGAGVDLVDKTAAVLPPTAAGVAGAALLRAIAAAGLTGAALRLLAASGHTDANALTNIAFWSTHPNLFGTKLRPSQPGFAALAAEWTHLRDGVVTEALSSRKAPKPSSGAASASTPVPSTTATGTPTGKGTATGGSAAPAAVGSLPELVAAAHNSSVDQAAEKLTELQRLSGAVARVERKGEERGPERAQLVGGIAELRGMIAQFAGSGLPAARVVELQAAFYRAIDLVSPFYWQHHNAMFEISTKHHQKADLYTTCNITSTSMALEALGKTAADYDRPDLLTAVLAAYKGHELKEAEGLPKDKAAPSLTDYRLPDILGLAAVVEILGRRADVPPEAMRTGQVEVAAAKSLLSLDTLKTLAKRFGVLASDPKSYHHDTLAALGEQTLINKDARKWKKYASYKDDDRARLAAQAPEVEQYSRDILAIFRPLLDQGKQVVVGQYKHFIRLRAVDEHGVVKADPGQYDEAVVRLTWDQARSDGMFENYLVLG
jgi:hypothetical protein